MRDIRKFHVAVVQRRLRNVEKSVMHLPSRCFADKNIHTNIHKSLYQAVQTQAESFLLLLSNNFPEKNAKLFVMALIKREILTSRKFV